MNSPNRTSCVIWIEGSDKEAKIIVSDSGGRSSIMRVTGKVRVA
jgi:hypothetical protein